MKYTITDVLLINIAHFNGCVLLLLKSMFQLDKSNLRIFLLGPENIGPAHQWFPNRFENRGGIFPKVVPHRKKGENKGVYNERGMKRMICILV